MRTLRHYIDLRADESPERVFLIAPETGLTLTYGRLRSDARDLAALLLRHGLRKGDKVSLMLHNGYQTANLLLGAMYGGFVVSPINLLAHPSQLAYVLDHSDTQLGFVAAEYEDRLKAALAKLARPVSIVVIDPDAANAAERQGSLGVALPDVHEDDDALLVYTSGTTGSPKGVMLTHGNVIAGGEYTSLAHELSSADRVLAVLPLYHINGQIVTAVAPLVHGGSVVMPRRFSTSDYWALVSDYRCTWLNFVPTIISYLLSGSDARAPGGELHLEQVRFARSASAPLPPSLHKAFERQFGIGVIETMGLTETAAPVFSNPLDRKRRKYGSPGIAVGNEAKIVDIRTGEALPPNQRGEIMIRGDNVMKGYYKAASITARTLELDGWLHTGDLGHVDDDGFYYVTGRLKELIIKGGENIAPREIDEALLKHPSILEAVAVGIPDAHYGQEIMACVVLKPDCRCTELELIEFCRVELGKYKTPKLIRFMDELPKGPSGKVQRLKLLDG
jgi:long-chain acyl-CoA synthetase